MLDFTLNLAMANKLDQNKKDDSISHKELVINQASLNGQITSSEAYKLMEVFRNVR